MAEKDVAVDRTTSFTRAYDRQRSGSRPLTSRKEGDYDDGRAYQ